MGAYLTQPNVEKESWERSSGRLSFGVSAMQGWRVAMEDAHSCLPELDSETALFAVYDGHGGAEVAQYCAKYLPDVIKEQAAYRDGKLHKALKDAFLALDARLTDAAVIRELKAMAVHDTRKGGTEMADEDDVDNEEAALLHEEATMTMEELLRRYGQGGNAARARKGIPPKPEHDGLNGEGSSCPKEPGKEAPSDGKPHGAAAGGNGVPEKSAPEPAGAADASPEGSAGRSESSGGGGSTAASTDDQSGTSSAPPAAPSSSAVIKKGAGPAARSARSAIKPVFFEDSDDDSDADKASSDEDEDSEDESCSEEEEESEEEESEEESEDEEDPDEENVGIPGMEIREEPGCDSGTTAVVALLRGSQLVVANAGDSRCVVSGGGGKAVEMSCDHKPEDQAELERICAAGGKVTMDGRVNGGLNLSRAIGDHFYKQNALLPPEKQMISALPDVRSLTLTEEHEFMVIACDGIWNVLSSQEVVDFVSERLHRRDAQGNLLTLSAITDELLDQCLAPDNTGDGTGCDNMTCLIVTFTLRPGCPAASAAIPASPVQESNKHKLESSVDGEEEGERVSEGEVRQKEKRARTEA